MSREMTTQTEATLTIKQMAAQSGMSEYTLRYYDKIGLIQPIPPGIGGTDCRSEPGDRPRAEIMYDKGEPDEEKMVYYWHLERIRTGVGGGGAQTRRQGRSNRASTGQPGRAQRKIR